MITITKYIKTECIYFNIVIFIPYFNTKYYTNIEHYKCPAAYS